MVNGYVIYDGPSQFDGSPILGILVTSPSSNRATGPDVCGLYIIDRDLVPSEAVKVGADASVCGHCPLRNTPANKAAGNGGCYVVPFLVNVVWKAWKKGSYSSTWTDATLKRAIGYRMMRLGVYGDPTALPIDLVKRIAKLSKGVLGYTHNWRKASPEWAGLLMASCETPDQVVKANKLGYRTFRVQLEGSPMLASEHRCAKDHIIPEHKRKQCGACKQCGGTSRSRHTGNIVITAHGGSSNKVAIKRTLAILN